MDKLRMNGASRRTERRSGGDRRQIDREPPGRHERRLGLEPRNPEVIEREMSDSEWISLTELPAAPRQRLP